MPIYGIECLEPQQLKSISGKDINRFDSDYNLMNSSKGQARLCLLSMGRTEIVMIEA
jgi:hypothetical protein